MCDPQVAYQIVYIIRIFISCETPGENKELTIAMNRQRENKLVADWSNECVNGGRFRFREGCCSLESLRAGLVTGASYNSQTGDLTVYDMLFLNSFLLTAAKTKIKISISVSPHAVGSCVGFPGFSPHPVNRPRVIVPVDVHYRMYVPREQLAKTQRDVIRVGDELKKELRLSKKIVRPF